MKIIDKIALIYIQDKKILVTKSKGKDVFYLPGGKRKNNETDMETLCREIKEELMVDIIPNSAIYYGIFYAEADGKSSNVLVKMTCYLADYEGKPQVDNEIDEICWLTYENIDNVSSVGRIVLYDLRHKGLL